MAIYVTLKWILGKKIDLINKVLELAPSSIYDLGYLNDFYYNSLFISVLRKNFNSKIYIYNYSY